ncbi:mitochondrial Rho GTPase 2-like [Convolutriloba macropyga]|uniref:mitochondrial Rho GTPase 2-like n=1 Tax=Convolutriloba macropyga TaxID=536237 RepID=UPI003F527F71
MCVRSANDGDNRDSCSSRLAAARGFLNRQNNTGHDFHPNQRRLNRRNQRNRVPNNRTLTRTPEGTGAVQTTEVLPEGTVMINGRTKQTKGIQRRDVRILLLGDSQVGKTSLILSLISEEFLEQVPARAEEITIPPDVTPQFVPTHIVDFSFQEQDESELFEEVHKAHVVCLLFALNELSSVDSLRSYWLPLLSGALSSPSRDVDSGGDRDPSSSPYDSTSPEHQRHPSSSNEKAPLPQIILVGSKSDLASPEPLIGSHIEPIMNEFPNIETFVACSAKDLSNVSEVFHYAQKAVLHPSSPLYNYEISELTMAATRALHRIFRLCDLDNDGLLSDPEINFLQVRAFGAPLDKVNLAEIKGLIHANTRGGSGIRNDSITEEGFLFLNNLFIQRGRIETTWSILRSFGYADTLRISDDLLEPNFDLKAGASVELTALGLEFLTSLFQKHDRDRDGCLSPSELTDLFDVCGARSSPWGMDVFHSVTTDTRGWIDLSGFLCQWNMTAYLDTPRLIEYLAYFGYMECDANNNSTAIRVTRPKSEDVKSRVCTRNVFLCHVIGPEGAGKSSFLQGLLGRTVKDLRRMDHVNELSRYAINSLNYKGHNKYLLMHDFDVVEEDFLTDEDLDCDVVVLMYDASDKTSFETVAILYRNHFLNPSPASAPFMPPVLICGAKSDRVEVRQEFEMSPVQFCRKHFLPPPVLVSSWSEIKPDVYNTLLSLAINPHKRRKYHYYYYSFMDNFWAKTALASGLVALTALVIYRKCIK